jgi:hypothetical protein
MAGNALSLTDAIKKVRDHFEHNCGNFTLTLWHVLSASEDIQKGAYVIQCVEHCYMEKDRAHEVWVDTKTGEITHQHRIDPKEKES